MRRAYEDERDIVDLAADVEDAEVCFYPAESDLAHRFLASLRGSGLDQRERPDFEDAAAMLLLEAMVVDDHPRPGRKDRTRMRESEMVRELEASGFDVHPDAHVFAAVSSGLPTDHDHNYQSYAGHFARTVLKHARKSEAYRAQRPGYELGFIVFDESTAYFENLGAFGRAGGGRPHVWFADSAFVDAILRSGADCFVWMTPYKRLETDAGIVPFPVMTIIDVALLRQAKLLDYDAGRMVSSER